jgi:hypothetical protein
MSQPRPQRKTPSKTQGPRMNEPLRPSSLGEILDRTVQLYRSRFLVFLGISVLPTAVVLVPAFSVFIAWYEWMESIGPTSASSAHSVFIGWLVLGAMGLAALAFLGALGLATAAMNYAVSRIHLGETATIRNAYKSVWRLGWRSVWLYLLEALIVWVAPLAAWIGLVFLSAYVTVWAKKAGMGAEADAAIAFLAVVGVLALVCYGIWMLVRLSLAFPACVVEELRIWPSTKRSSALTKGTMGRILLLCLLVAALGCLLSIGIVVLLTILLYLIPGMSGAQHQQTAGVFMLFILLGTPCVVQVLVRPVYGIALVLFYYDQRIRQEGFDIEWMMLKAGMLPQPLAVASQAPTSVSEAEQEAAPWLPVIPRQGQLNEPKPMPSQPGENA